MFLMATPSADGYLRSRWNECNTKALDELSQTEYSTYGNPGKGAAWGVGFILWTSMREPMVKRADQPMVRAIDPKRDTKQIAA